MDDDKMSCGRMSRRTPLIALLGAAIIMVAVTPTAALATKQEIEETIDFTDKFLDDDMQEIGPLRFTPRWSDVESVAPKRIGVFFADCRPGESGVEPREPVVSSQEVNNTINNIVVIREGDVVQNIDINIDMKVNQAVEIRQTVNQIAVQVNNNGGDAQLVVNQIAQLATGDDIEQKAKVQQFLEQADPESPQFEETVRSLTRQSQQLQQQGPDTNATLVLPEPGPGVMTNETSTEDLGDNATELEQQPIQPGLNATDEDNATTAGEDDNATELEQQPIQPGLNATDEDNATTAGEDENATELEQQPIQPGLNATDEDNATTAGEDDNATELEQQPIQPGL